MLKLITPILLLAGAFFLGKYLIATGPEPKKKATSATVPVVEVMPLKLKNYTVYIKASGIVKAGIQSNLVSEVAGKVVRISDDFQEGAYFDAKTTLIEIDKQNYLNSVSIARSDVAANMSNLKQLIEEEKSNSRSIKLAKRNLQLGNKEVVRLRGLWKKKLIARSLVDAEEQKQNQLEQKLQELQGKQNTYASRRSVIEAQINSAQARLKQEELDLSRTLIQAPYAGRVLKKNVDIGQFVSKGTVLGEIYATDYVNVELPLSLNQYELLGMQESFRNKKVDQDKLPEVTFTHADSTRKDSWKGRVVRSSAALDAESRLINVIVRIDKPFDLKKEDEEAEYGVPVRIGQYLNARIKGKTFKDVYVLPPVAVRHNREILLLRDGKINIVPVNVVWNASDVTVVTSQQPLMGEHLVITSLNQAVEGMNVISLDEQLRLSEQKKKNKKQIEKSKVAHKNKVAAAKDKETK